MVKCVYFASSGVAALALAPAWEYLKRVDTGADEGAPPAWFEVGGGWYKTADFTPAVNEVGVVDGGAALANQDRYVPITWFVTENLDDADLLKRLKVVFDGDTTRVEAAGSVTHTFLDAAAATETTHTLTAAGRTVT